MPDSDPEQLLFIARQFARDAAVLRVIPHGTGRVNATFLVKTTFLPPLDCFILQKINTEVFPHPEWIMENLRRLCNHLVVQAASKVRWEIPMPIPALDGKDWFVDEYGGFWRALTFIRDALPLDSVQSTDNAFEAGRALGLFQAMVASLPPHSLLDTLPGFHVTPRYLALYDDVVTKNDPALGRQSMEHFCVSFIEERRGGVHILEQARKEGRAAERIIHGDPKSSNIMIDDITEQAIGMVDLDTVKPGLVLCDLGDCLRSCCNRVGEDFDEPTAVKFDMNFYEAVLNGYMSESGYLLLPSELELVPDAVRLIALELGIRYFTDHLAGNRYFRTDQPDGNLYRAIIQFHLVLDIERQMPELRDVAMLASEMGFKKSI